MSYLQQNKIECNLYNQDIGFFYHSAWQIGRVFFSTEKSLRPWTKVLLRRLPLNK